MDAARPVPGTPVTRARELVDRKDWDGLATLCDQYWLALPERHESAMVALLEEVPEAEFAARPSLLVAWVICYHAMVDQDSRDRRPFLRQYMELGTRLAGSLDPERESSPANLILIGTLAMITLRGQGRFEEAEARGQRVAERLAVLHPLPAVEPAPRPGWLAMQRGLTRSLQADFDGAAEQYRLAHEQARAEPTAYFAGTNATANLAMIFAHLGHHETARKWLDEHESYPPSPRWASTLLEVGATIARGWDALDRYDFTRFDRIAEATGDGTESFEVWPFIAALMAERGLHTGGPAQALAHLSTIRLSHAPALTGQGAARQVLLRAEAELLIALGEGNRALRVLTEAGPVPWLAVPAARLRLLAGDHEAASALASQGLWAMRAVPRDTRQLLLIKAVAAVRAGRTEEAAGLLAALPALRSPHEVLSLATVPPAEREELLRLARIPLSDDAAARLATAGPVYPERVTLVELTARERAVLAELATGDTTPDIAARLVVSAATVRTQVQSIYRKLGVSSRKDALLRARELGLLGYEVHCG
ncbi:LuxR C-terminal-related transcriptional regulator [Amycolatopsis cynarae]|uniref:LuxR C-terminal-related transcriptional regulator n=1 Tax=Amycolatopsis cynarae TaxID=2995223 RepID=A0ABY7AW52_9PSEU|nr:LuxR C-terminal-related transcriptional regulator [Amycolatopsis sp. HUAS 11-8]WAL63972.1 LuxR C-terminal-related transcriptional regulator [Amycolatopsis sp. HUAS 11-8]